MDWLSSMRGVFNFAFPTLEPLPVIKAILAFILVFFLPGFAWTLIFFRQVNILERVVLSFGLSMAVVTLGILSLNWLVDVRITWLNSVLIIITITIIPVAAYYLMRLVKRK